MAAAVGVAVITTGLLVGAITWAATAASAESKYQSAAEAAASEAEAEAAELKADADRIREAAAKLTASVPITTYMTQHGIKECPDCKCKFLDPKYTAPDDLQKKCIDPAIKANKNVDRGILIMRCGLADPNYHAEFESELEDYLKCAGEVCGRDFRASVGATEWACLAKKCAKARQEENFFGVGNIKLTSLV